MFLINYFKKSTYLLLKKFYIRLIIFTDSIFIFLISLKIIKDITNEILFIRIDMVGDLFSWLPLLKSEFSQKISIICSDNVSDYLKSLNIFTGVYPLDIERFKIIGLYRYRMMNLFIKINPRITVNARFSRSIILDDSICRIFKNSKTNIVGINGDNFNISAEDKIISNNWYCEIIEIPRNIKNEIQRNKYILAKIKEMNNE